MSWLIADEGDFGERLAQLRDTPSVAPSLCLFEVCNALQMAVRRERVMASDAVAALDLFFELGIEIEPPPNREIANRIVSLCGAHAVSAYDASYLELAMRKSAVLATCDERLSRIATNLGIGLL
jgi:predicted nucleic acid-binding protein